jgi:hypothetical protein
VDGRVHYPPSFKLGSFGKKRFRIKKGVTLNSETKKVGGNDRF